MDKINWSELPKEVELKKKLIICPKCQAAIEVDLTIDISQVTDMIEALGKAKL